LASFPDARGAEALSKKLGNFFNDKNAARALRRMGPVGEDALIKVASSDIPEVSLAAVQLLGEVGTQKSLTLLAKAAKSPNPDVASAAKTSMGSIRERMKKTAK